MPRISAPKDECLKTIDMLDPLGAGARIADLALSLSVAKVSAAHMAAQLEEEGLAERFGKNRVGLTEKGRHIARKAEERYETIQQYFVEILHVNGPLAAKEAGELQHHLSDACVAQMRRDLTEHEGLNTPANLVPA